MQIYDRSNEKKRKFTMNEKKLKRFHFDLGKIQNAFWHIYKKSLNVKESPMMHLSKLIFNV